MSINEKIKEVLLVTKLSPSHLADDIGVQRSSISHILSGRNRPSLDLIQKIVRRFPQFTYDWFLDDELQLTTESKPSTFDTKQATTHPPTLNLLKNQRTEKAVPLEKSGVVKTGTSDLNEVSGLASPGQGKQAIERILIFYTDGTFKEYTPTITT